MSDSDKDRFDQIKNSDETQAECFERILDRFENADEPVVIDVDEIAERIDEKVASNVEVAAYRGIVDALEKHT